MAGLEDAIAEIAPQWRPAGPTGGFIAAELKRIHDGSMSVFPESVYSAEGVRRKTRWNTTMKSDFIPIEQLRAQAEARKAIKGQIGNMAEDDMGVTGALGGPNSMFQSWKVPSRLTHHDSRSGTRASIHSVAQELEDMRLESAASGEKSALPRIHGASPRPDSVLSVAVSRASGRQKKPDRQPKSLAAKMLFDGYHQRDERTTAERWLAQASDAEKKMVGKAIKMGQPKDKDDVTSPVKKWLEGASSKEREVALTFFQSIAGTQLMGGSPDKKAKVDQVIQILERPSSKSETQTAELRQSNTGKPLRHVNLLRQSARNNKWRHQTWHNLPSYPNKSKVLNKSAILVAPHGTIPRHFTIHPDWGP